MPNSKPFPSKEADLNTYFQVDFAKWGKVVKAGNIVSN